MFKPHSPFSSVFNQDDVTMILRLLPEDGAAARRPGRSTVGPAGIRVNWLAVVTSTVTVAGLVTVTVSDRPGGLAPDSDGDAAAWSPGYVTLVPCPAAWPRARRRATPGW